MNDTRSPKIFEVCDCEWWIGLDAESVRQAVMESGYAAEDLADIQELDDSDLERLKYTDCDEDERPIGAVRTFREQLAIEAAAGGELPRLFAAEQW